MSGKNNSAVIFQRLLGTEGYSDHVHNQIEKYWKHRIMDQRRGKRIARVEKEFSELMDDMSEADKLLVGRFISLRSKMSFDAGLRTGMQALLRKKGIA